MVPVKNEPDAVPACHDSVDIHPVEMIKKTCFPVDGFFNMYL